MKKVLTFLLAFLMAFAVIAPLAAYTPGAPPGAVIVATALDEFDQPIATVATTIPQKTEAIVASLDPGSANICVILALPYDYYTIACRPTLAGLMQGVTSSYLGSYVSIAQDYGMNIEHGNLEWV